MEKTLIIACAVGLGGIVAYAFYCAADAKAHAQPVRFFAVALGAIVLAFLANIASDQYASVASPATKALAPIWTQIAGMLNLTCGAFAGALASAAITNRAKFSHDKKTSQLPAKLAAIQGLLQAAMAELKVASAQPEPSDIYDAMQLMKKKSELDELILRQLDKIKKVSDELDALGTL